jgi:Flp pilus assembly protein TadD
MPAQTRVRNLGSTGLPLARHHLEQGRLHRALEVLGRCSLEEMETRQFHQLRGVALYRLEHYDEAVAAARAGLARDPSCPLLSQLLGVAEMQRGDLVAAERALLAALIYDPESVALLCSYAVVMIRAGQVAKAVRLTERAARTDPESDVVALLRGILDYIFSGQQRRAEGCRIASRRGRLPAVQLAALAACAPWLRPACG